MATKAGLTSLKKLISAAMERNSRWVACMCTLRQYSRLDIKHNSNIWLSASPDPMSGYSPFKLLVMIQVIG